MSHAVQEHIDMYQERINALYAEAKNWAEPLSAEEGNVQVTERLSGSYSVPCLILKAPEGSEVARLEPVGTYILGAEGRVDLKGHNGKEAIVYLVNDGPTLSFGNAEAGVEPDRSPVALFQGIDRHGWYWIEDSRRGRARLMTKALFRDLVSEVSDYAFE